jgi:hypothetical protein
LIGAAMAMAGREPDWIEKRVAEFADRFAKAAEGESIQVAADWVHKMAGGRELRDDSGPGLCEDGRSVMWYVQFGDDEWMGVCADSPRQINPDDFDPDAWRIRFVYALLGSYLREKLELPAASAPRGAQ